LDQQALGQLLLFLPVFLFSVIVHECSHGLVALWRGDPTAKYAGRLTLNPIPHLDLYGSIILPGLLLFMGSRMLFGWAKPVPINEHNLYDPPNDSLKVAAAGPVSNILLAYAFALVLSMTVRVLPSAFAGVALLCQAGVVINCLLAVFNLLPIPPLDGHWLVLRFLPPEAARAYRQIGFLGVLLILGLFMIPAVRQALVGVPVSFLAFWIGRAAGVPPGVGL
jgi:Zn-dependent protease